MTTYLEFPNTIKPRDRGDVTRRIGDFREIVQLAQFGVRRSDDYGLSPARPGSVQREFPLHGIPGALNVNAGSRQAASHFMLLGSITLRRILSTSSL